MATNAVVVVFDPQVPQTADGLPDLGVPLLDWVRIGALTAVRLADTDFDSTVRLLAGYVVDSALEPAARRMPPGLGPWCWDCYDQRFEFAAGDGWPPPDDGPAVEP